MNEARFNLSGMRMAIVVAVVFLVIAALGLPYAVNFFIALEKTSEQLTFAQVVVSLLGFIGAITAFTFAVVQYRKAEKWRRMQFVADEVRELESDPKIDNALLLADWGTRKINLSLVPNPKPKDYVEVSREMQWRALLPHPLKKDFKDYRANVRTVLDKTGDQGLSDDDAEFNVTEVLIRDAYDAFLTRLDRLETFIDAGLIGGDDLRPFISYWVKTLTKRDGIGDIATWRFTVLTYINYYEFTGVNSLFKRYGMPIGPEGEIYQAIKSNLADQNLAELLEGQLKKE